MDQLGSLKRINSKVPRIQEVGYQSWTEENLSIESYHDEILYYTSRWDALCPYVDITEGMLESAPRPFIVYALPPDSPYGVQINDKYGLVEAGSPEFEGNPRRARKFRDIEKQYRDFSHSEEIIPGRDLSADDIFQMGRQHFENCYIDPREVEGFIDYIRKLEVLVLKVHDPEGELVLTDVSVLLPDYDQVYGSFCEWNRAFKSRSPGIYACLLASRWAAKNGYRFYNLGPVDDYGYKSLFVTHHEPIFALALTDLDDPLALDPTSPLFTDFKREEWNQIHRACGGARVVPAPQA